MAQKMCFIFRIRKQSSSGSTASAKSYFDCRTTKQTNVLHAFFRYYSRWIPNVCSTTTWDMLTRSSDEVVSCFECERTAVRAVKQVEA